MQPVSIACLMCLCVGLQYCDGHGEQEGGWRRKKKKNPGSIIFHLKCATDGKKRESLKYGRLIQAFVSSNTNL